MTDQTSSSCETVLRGFGDLLRHQYRRHPAATRSHLIFLICIGLSMFLITTYQRQVNMMQSHDQDIPYSKTRIKGKNSNSASSNKGGRKKQKASIQNKREDVPTSSSTLRIKEGAIVSKSSTNDNPKTSQRNGSAERPEEKEPERYAKGEDSQGGIPLSENDQAGDNLGPLELQHDAATEAADGRSQSSNTRSAYEKTAQSIESPIRRAPEKRTSLASALERAVIPDPLVSPTNNPITSSSLESVTAKANSIVLQAASSGVLEEGEEVVDAGLASAVKFNVDCGCPKTCNTVALRRKAKQNFFCIDRINFLINKRKTNETEACMIAAGDNGPCGLECHPVHCHDQAALQPKPLNWTSVAAVERPEDDFVRYDKVVVATKVLWPNDLYRLKQMICLFTAAYNRHVNYDIIVFTTVPWTRLQVRELQSVAPQTNIRIVLDSPPLQEQLSTMSPEEIQFLKERCRVKPGDNITWFHHCTEEGFRNAANLAYSWQSEFRAYHIWKTPVLSEYKYMMWMDSDALCTKPWPKDPMKLMVENDLVLMFDNFPQGACTNNRIKEKLMTAYNRTICKVYLSDDGQLNPHACGDNQSVRIGNVHGFHHITNLDFYRSPKNLRFLELLVSDYRFSRQWDDQLGVTVPAAMEAPHRAWDYRRHGLNMSIHHNGRLDGKEGNIAFGYNFFWERIGKKEWQAAREMCDNFVVFKD